MNKFRWWTLSMMVSALIWFVAISLILRIIK